jgi:hypothetical protein
MAFLETDEFKIFETESTYMLVLSESSEYIMRSIMHLDCFKVSDNYRSVPFHGKSITTLDKILGTIEDRPMHFFFSCIGNQLKYLIHEGVCFSELDPKYMLIIDNICICLSLRSLHSLDANGKIIINTPFKKNIFHSPELHAIRSLPSKIPFQCIYYSLGCIVIYNMRQVIASGECPRSEWLNTLESIKGSKLYFTLVRCLAEVPENRSIIYI